MVFAGKPVCWLLLLGDSTKGERMARSLPGTVPSLSWVEKECPRCLRQRGLVMMWNLPVSGALKPRLSETRKFHMAELIAPAPQICQGKIFGYCQAAW